MFARADLRPLGQQQGDHHKRTVVAVRHGDVAGMQASQQCSQQGRLARLFALVRPHRQVHQAGRGQRNDGHGTRDGQSHSRLLAFLLRILGSVFGCVGHREREAVDQLRMVFAFPQPALVGGLLQFLRHFAAQFLQRPLGELGSGSAIVTSILRRRGDSLLLAVTDDARHRRLTRGFFAVPQHLTQKTPNHDRRRVDRVETEQVAMLGKDSRHTFGREHVSEWQSRLRQERRDHLLKLTTRAAAGIRYVAHENALLG